MKTYVFLAYFYTHLLLFYISSLEPATCDINIEGCFIRAFSHYTVTTNSYSMSYMTWLVSE